MIILNTRRIKILKDIKFFFFFVRGKKRRNGSFRFEEFVQKCFRNINHSNLEKRI